MRQPQPGVLDQRVAIQQQASVSDGRGGMIPGGWSTVRTVWASVSPIRGAESIDAGQQTATQTYLLMMRRTVSVDTNSRLIWEGRTLLVREAAPPRRDIYRKIVAEEIIP